MTVGIAGLGLIGGSMAKSIKIRTSHTVLAADIDRETLMLARLCGAMDAPLTEENLPQCDLVLVALRPGAAIRWVTEHAPLISPGAVVVDLCGTKRRVVDALEPVAREHGFTYIGGHPMAGSERGGFVNSRAELFTGASMILTPGEGIGIATLEMLKNFFIDLGFAGLTFSTPEEHDRIIAYTSQLAHITSSAFIKSPEAQRRRGFSAGSFQDMTRVALLDEEMWTELCLDNADFLTEQLELLIAHLEEYYRALKIRDGEMLRALFREGREKKASAGGS